MALDVTGTDPGGLGTSAWFALLTVSALLAAWALTWLTRWIAERRAILDAPNHRSSHMRPTPKGGGLAITAVLLTSWAGLTLWPAAALEVAAFDPRPVIALAALLAAMSWLDDLRGLSPLFRFPVQIAIAALGLSSFPESALVFQGWLPPLADRVLTVIVWVWFLNLYNFMDGIDGITGIESLVITGGLCLLALLGAAPAALGWLALFAAAAVAGFLPWNWAPARIFAGDVGSVTLGFVLGWLLLWLAASGQWAAALILPLYYLVDSGTTLLARLARREKIWEAHRDHAYQKAVRRGLGHDGVSLRVLLAGFALVCFAVVAAAGAPWVSFFCALLVVGALMANLLKGRDTPPARAA